MYLFGQSYYLEVMNEMGRAAAEELGIPVRWDFRPTSSYFGWGWNPPKYVRRPVQAWRNVGGTPWEQRR